MVKQLRNKLSYGIFKKPFKELNLNECAMINSEISTKGKVFQLYPKLINKQRRKR